MDLAQLLHDLVHPDETHLKPGSFYRDIAEQLTAEAADNGLGSLYRWLHDRTDTPHTHSRVVTCLQCGTAEPGPEYLHH